jgi:hypothetical protein
VAVALCLSLEAAILLAAVGAATTNFVSLPAEPEAVGFQRRKAPASMNGCVTGTHPPKLSDGGDRAIDLADNVSDTFRPHLGAVLAIPGNFAVVAGPERC